MNKNKRNPNNLAVTIDAESHGVVVWWKLRGDTGIARMVHKANELDFNPEHLPEPPTADVCLRRALTEHRSAKCDVRQTKDGHWHCTPVRSVGAAEGDRPEYETILSVWLEDDELKFDMVRRTAEAREIHEKIKIDFVAMQRVLSAQDISFWLVRKLEALLGVTLREQGGVYFIPKEKADLWAKIVEIIEACGEHRVMELPVRKTEKLVEEIMDGLNDEARAFAEEVRLKIGAEVGERALLNRAESLEELEQKIHTYEGILGRKMKDMRVVLDEVEASISVALLKAQKAGAET